MEFETIFRSTRAVAGGVVGPRSIHVRGGIITRLGDYHEELPANVPIIDVGDLVILPGIVDSHVHINEPGRTEWEGFATATRAAAAGGVTTLVDMPLNSIPPTVSVADLTTKAAAAEG